MLYKTLPTAFVPIAAILLSASLAFAQWSPSAGQWDKSDPNDVRIMTWNIEDAICSTNAKVEGANDWCAVARIVAAMRPDVLILQECGDNSGEGTGSTMDTVAQLTTTIGMFFHGGSDTFHSNSTITSWVQKYASGYDLPYVFVSSANDGFNRNVILSRYPFGDVNGDGIATYSDFSMQADAYAPGGTGGIRGFATAEILLPRATYAGDLVMGCCHLKSGSTSSDLADRLTAAENISYYIDRLFNGGGTNTPDPNHKITLSPRPTTILGPHTPFICGGGLPTRALPPKGSYGPAQWIAQGPAAAGTDGNDRDRTDSTYDDARDLFSNSPYTEQSSPSSTSYKDDYLVWQDSIATLRRVWIFNTANIPAAGIPSELTAFTGGPSGASHAAADHRPVVGDFILALSQPALPGAFALLSPAPGAVGVAPNTTLSWSSSAGASSYTVTIAPAGGTSTMFSPSATKFPDGAPRHAPGLSGSDLGRHGRQHRRIHTLLPCNADLHDRRLSGLQRRRGPGHGRGHRRLLRLPRRELLCHLRLCRLQWRWGPGDRFRYRELLPGSCRRLVLSLSRPPGRLVLTDRCAASDAVRFSSFRPTIP